MHIDSINNLNFNGWNRTVFRKEKCVASAINEVKHRNDTYFFREMHWDFFLKLLQEKYKSVSKVNIYNYGCSDGSEPLSVVMKILCYFRENSKKFFPIKASDYDAIAIQTAKNNEYYLDKYELSAIDKHTKGYKFFSKNRNGSYSANKFLIDCVDYELEDAISHSKNIKGDNNIIFARNFWPYLSKEKMQEFAENLYKNIGNNSMLIIGNFDASGRDIIKTLYQVGFREIVLNSNIFIRQNEGIPKAAMNTQLNYIVDQL